MALFPKCTQSNVIKGLILALVFVYGCGLIDAERRCYNFTWLGPEFNNGSTFINSTCQDATRLSDGVPCVQPLVVSEDGTWPDVDQIWTEYKDAATCILGDTDVCAQYTYYFDGFPLNSTYMCTRAVNTLGNAITSGCYQQDAGSSRTRVCFCQSYIGGLPCNSAADHHVPSFILLVIISFLSICKYIIL